MQQRERCTYNQRARNSCACRACRTREKQRAARSRGAAEEAGFWPVGDGEFLDTAGYMERFDIAARIQAACNMIAFANDVVKLPPITAPVQGTAALTRRRAGLAYVTSFSHCIFVTSCAGTRCMKCLARTCTPQHSAAFAASLLSLASSSLPLASTNTGAPSSSAACSAATSTERRCCRLCAAFGAHAC